MRRAGKRVVAYATGYSDDSYQLAAHADEIWLDPLGAVLIAGPGGSNLYYAGLLERIGVTAHVYRVGAFKSAVEPYTRNDMSPEARAASQALADALWETWRQDVAPARPRARIADWVANPRLPPAGGRRHGAGGPARRADRPGRRPHPVRRSAWRSSPAMTTTASPAATMPSITRPGSTSTGRAHAGGEIGILTVAGNIVDGEAGPGTAGGETDRRAISSAGWSAATFGRWWFGSIRPGGSVIASERIRRALLAAKARGLPVVISMGSVAASGGYWVATAGDVIYAEPSTITGSIGVFGILPSFEGTLQRLGIGADGVSTTPLSGEPDLLRGPSPEAERLLQTGVESTYRRFIDLVARGAAAARARVHEIAQGRVWSGGTARQLGLVDRFGSLDDAVAEAARRAGLDPATARRAYLEREPGFLARLFGGSAATMPPARRATPSPGWRAARRR